MTNKHTTELRLYRALIPFIIAIQYNINSYSREENTEFNFFVAAAVA